MEGNGQSNGQVVNGKRVFIGVPYHSGIEPEVSQAVYCSAGQGDPRFAVVVETRLSSLLCMGFNACWCDCQNSQEPFDYWLLNHADVQAVNPDGCSWLARMVDLLEEHKLDGLHVACTIKDNQGLSSTALGLLHDQWAPIRKLTLHELQELPEVFTTDDFQEHKWTDSWASTADSWHWRASWLGEEGERPQVVLLPNTGLLLLKRGPWWDRFPGFNIQDRVVALCRDGSLCPVEDYDWENQPRVARASQVVPEDWNFGRWAALNGLRIGGTIAIETKHCGKAMYSNKVPYGSAVDQGFFNAMRVAKKPTLEEVKA